MYSPKTHISRRGLALLIDVNLT